jgi:molybdopterin synthase catalytic subunit
MAEEDLADRGPMRPSDGVQSDKITAVDAVKILGITENPLSLADIYASVSGVSTAGGIALFVGVVRSEDHGRAVTSLGYSAHPSAESVLREVVEKAVAQYAIHAVSAVHRTGDLGIGDTAVIVAVACPGRADAFTACRQIIDDIKHDVPIWKNQIFADGEAEWVGIGDS